MNFRWLISLLVFATPSTHAGEPILSDETSPGVPKAEMVSAFLKKEAFAFLDRRQEAFEKIESKADIEQWQAERCDFFKEQLGGFPEKRTPLNAKVTGTLEGDGYRVEKVIFESQPGFHVTANLYLPEGDGPFPAVLHPTGHSANAKNRDVYQMASITIARGGCAVLCYDPIGQGERDQVFQADGKPYSSTLQHTLINQGMHLLGSNTARTMIWDGMRAIDYLQSRPDIDPKKIGCTGISGGGTNTSYLMALDDRIIAAAPGCYLTGYRSLLNTIGPQDAEQNIHGQLAFGMDHSDYVLMRLPQPTLIMAATSDYFDIEGAWRLFREGKRTATRLDFPERVDLVEPDTDHGFPPGMRVAAANWMRRWLLENDEPIGIEKVPVAVPEEELNVLETAAVLELDGAKSNFDLTAERCKTFAERRAENTKPENREALRKKIRELIAAREIADLPEPKVKKVSENRFIIESEPGIFLPAHLVSPGRVAGRLHQAIFLHGGGIEAALASGEIEKLQAKLATEVLVVDLRGLGETKKANSGKGFDELFGPDWKTTTLASLLGKSYVGMRAEDTWQIVRAWREISGNENLKPHLIAIGEPGIPALHAAALQSEYFGNVRISGSIKSWIEIVETPVVRNQQPNLVFGALREYDLPVLREMLGERLTFEDPAGVADGVK
ncbi:MAG: hypothetical protein HKN23_11170 [Verrucomicrobiales bacterium]|nr:hypothetical protein [Verrucomicrobiales bacterium]